MMVKMVTSHDSCHSVVAHVIVTVTSSYNTEMNIKSFRTSNVTITWLSHICLIDNIQPLGSVRYSQAQTINLAYIR